MVAWLIGPAFLVVAAWFLWGPAPAGAPSRELIAPGPVTNDPPRAPIADPPTLQVAGFTKKCTECHSLFRSNPNQALHLNQHRNIVQGHGMNDRCFNCHDGVDRARLVLPGGATVSFADSARLCATCHGTTFRDWQLGMHGRTTGSWDDASPAFARLTCIQCHDPHAPAFPPMTALPGPSTLRMGDPSAHEHGPPKRRNPLRQWSGGNEETHP